MRVYHFILDAEEVGLDLEYFDLDQHPLVLYDGQGRRPDGIEQGRRRGGDAREAWTPK